MDNEKKGGAASAGTVVAGVTSDHMKGRGLAGVGDIRRLAERGRDVTSPEYLTSPDRCSQETRNKGTYKAGEWGVQWNEKRNCRVAINAAREGRRAVVGEMQDATESGDN